MLRMPGRQAWNALSHQLQVHPDHIDQPRHFNTDVNGNNLEDKCLGFVGQPAIVLSNHPPTMRILGVC